MKFFKKKNLDNLPVFFQIMIPETILFFISGVICLIIKVVFYPT